MLKRAWISTLVVLFAATVCIAQKIDPPATAATPAPSGPKDSGKTGPLDNTGPANARTLVPDGASVSDSQGATLGKWYVANVEHGKSYVLEVMDPFGDLSANCVNTTVYDSDGITTPPASTELDTSTAHVAPSMEVSDDGERVAIRPDIGGPASRNYFFKVTQCGSVFFIRLRESTVYSRWTVNGYNMFVAFQNTTLTDVQVQALYYSDAGALVTNNVVTVPGFGAAQITSPSGSLAPNHGALRIQWWGLGEGLVPGQINVQTYAFNPAAGNYLTFLPERVNDGRTAQNF